MLVLIKKWCRFQRMWTNERFQNMYSKSAKWWWESKFCRCETRAHRLDLNSHYPSNKHRKYQRNAISHYSMQQDCHLLNFVFQKSSVSSNQWFQFSFVNSFVNGGGCGCMLLSLFKVRWYVHHLHPLPVQIGLAKIAWFLDAPETNFLQSM